jgi:hypothetical protein
MAMTTNNADLWDMMLFIIWYKFTFVSEETTASTFTVKGRYRYWVLPTRLQVYTRIRDVLNRTIFYSQF